VIFTYPDVVVILLFNAILYSVFYGVTASLSSLFKEDYPSLSETDLGLCFLAVGGGMIVGSTITGKLLDRDYRAIQKKIARNLGTDTERGQRSDVEFPIEMARLRSMPIYIFIYTAVVVGYGWCLQKRVHIAAPLILQFIGSFSFL
jgi:hypothetical protein